jgi:IS30 family transposase
MARTGRPSLLQQQKDELWQRWKDGQSLSDIGRALGKHAASVFGVLLAKGGIAPRTRLRKAGFLSHLECEEISRGLVAGFSFCSIGKLLGRAPSTISREVARNSSRKTYRAMNAESDALQRSLRPKLCNLAVVPSLQMLVAEKLRCQLSPQQISGWLKVEHPGDRTMQVSHETIYKSLFIQARGVLKKELLAHLRSRRIMRR